MGWHLLRIRRLLPKRCLASHPSAHVCHCTRKRTHPGAHVCYCGAGWNVDVPTDRLAHIPPHPPLREEGELLTKWSGVPDEAEEARSVEYRRQKAQDDHLDELARQKERQQEQPLHREDEEDAQHHEDYLAHPPTQSESERIRDSVGGGQQPGLGEHSGRWNEEQAELRGERDR